MAARAGPVGRVTARLERLLLDEMLPPDLATTLNEHGLDALAVAAQPELVGTSDYQLVELAVLAQRTLVTMDVGGFHRIHINRTAIDAPMPPLILVSAARFPTSRGSLPQLAAALIAAIESGGATAHGGIRWLAPVAGRRAGPNKQLR